LKYNNLEKIRKDIFNYSLEHDENLYSFWIMTSLKWIVPAPFKACVFCKNKEWTTDHLFQCIMLQDKIKEIDDKIYNYLKSIQILNQKKSHINYSRNGIKLLVNKDKYAVMWVHSELY